MLSGDLDKRTAFFIPNRFLRYLLYTKKLFHESRNRKTSSPVFKFDEISIWNNV